MATLACADAAADAKPATRGPPKELFDPIAPPPPTSPVAASRSPMNKGATSGREPLYRPKSPGVVSARGTTWGV